MLVTFWESATRWCKDKLSIPVSVSISRGQSVEELLEKDERTFSYLLTSLLVKARRFKMNSPLPLKGSSSCRQPLLTLTSLPQGKIDVCSVIALNSFAVWGKLVNKCSITRWLPRLPVGSQAASKQWRPDLVQSLTNRSQHSAINWSESVLMSATGLRCLTIGHLTKLVLEWLYYGYISLCFFKCLNSCS